MKGEKMNLCPCGEPAHGYPLYECPRCFDSIDACGRCARAGIGYAYDAHVATWKKRHDCLKDPQFVGVDAGDMIRWEVDGTENLSMVISRMRCNACGRTDALRLSGGTLCRSCESFGWGVVEKAEGVEIDEKAATFDVAAAATRPAGCPAQEPKTARPVTEDLLRQFWMDGFAYGKSTFSREGPEDVWDGSVAARLAKELCRGECAVEGGT